MLLVAFMAPWPDQPCPYPGCGQQIRDLLAEMVPNLDQATSAFKAVIGQIGLEAFRHLLKDRRLRGVPMYLETPKGDHNGQSWDAINLRTLRRLASE